MNCCLYVPCQDHKITILFVTWYIWCVSGYDCGQVGIVHFKVAMSIFVIIFASHPIDQGFPLEGQKDFCVWQVHVFIGRNPVFSWRNDPTFICHYVLDSLL